MADYTFQQVLVWDILPGGTLRTLRNGTVTVKNAADDSTLFNVTSDPNGLATFTTTDVATVYLVSPNGLVSEHITAASVLESAAAAALNNDAGVASFVNDTGSATRAALNSTYETGAAKVLYVSPSGNDSRNGKTWGTAKATIAAALTAMGTSKGTVVLDNGTHNINATLAWPSTATCGMVGQGPGNTVIQATAQTGPVLDLTAVGYGLNDSEFGGFTLKGDGTSGTAKKGLALSSTVSMVGAHFHDISVTNTGGAPFDLGMAELCSFDRLLADAPVGVDTNNVPYLMATGAFNGNTISRLCLSANVANPGTGLSGAVVIKDNGSTAPHDNKITDAQIQGLRVTTNSTIFAIAGNANVLSDIQMFDAGKVSGSTGTSVVRFSPPAVTDLGGNLVRGVIPGKGSDATSFDTGIDVRQSRNSIEGVKGFRGTNVTLASGVGFTGVTLRGAVSTAIDPAVVDNSGQTTNTVTDTYLGVIAGSGGGYKAAKTGGYYGPGNHVAGTYASSAGNLMAVPVDLPSMTAVSIECNVTVAGAAGTTVRLGIYSNAGNDGPGALVLDAGSVAADTTGIKAVTISQFLAAGRYWLAAVPQGGNPTFTAVTSSLTPVAPAAFTGGNTCYYRASVTGTLPNPFGSVSPFSPGIKVMVKSA